MPETSRKPTEAMERISALEAGQERLSRDVSGLTSAIERQGAETRQMIGELSNRVNAAQKTNWPTFIGALTLVALVIGGLLSGYVRDLNRVETWIHDFVEQQREHEHFSADRHSKWNERIRALERNVFSNQTGRGEPPAGE